MKRWDRRFFYERRKDLFEIGYPVWEGLKTPEDGGWMCNDEGVGELSWERNVSVKGRGCARMIQGCGGLGVRGRRKEYCID